MAKIRSINKSVRSMKLTVPYDGTIDINADGVVEVSDACAEALGKRNTRLGVCG